MFSVKIRMAADKDDFGINPMKKSDVTCPECGAGYRRIELTSRLGTKGKFRCLVCDHLLETFDGLCEVAIV